MLRVLGLCCRRVAGVSVPMAVFRLGTSPLILFKSTSPCIREEEEWHRVAWNFGVAPLLWVTTPEYIKLYNAFQPPEEYGKRTPLLGEFHYGDTLNEVYANVAEVCGRRHVTSASFWASPLARSIDRQSRVDNVLLIELSYLISALHDRGIHPSLAQKLVGRCIFFQYLLHRGYLSEGELLEHFGAPTLNAILSDLDTTYRVFGWIRNTFNGDLFPIEDEASERQKLFHSAHALQPLSDFFGHFNIADGQGRLFPFRFDAIPVELISSIYEKFAHMSPTDGSSRSGMHYTPINLVDLALDSVFEEIDADARVLDPACGSGVFLVESLRRLTWLRSRQEALNRELVSDVLSNQIRGVDVSPAALSVAAFSLYLALLELDPCPPSGMDALSCLRFEPLQDRVLFTSSVFDSRLENRLFPEDSGRRFDIIVGNPPWTYSASEKEADRSLKRRSKARRDKQQDDGTEIAIEHAYSGTTYARQKGHQIPPRSPDWAFLWRCLDLGHEATRIALIMKATPFSSLAPKARSAREAVLRAFSSVSLVNLSQLRTARLFQEYETWNEDKKEKKRAAGPALLFFSNCLPTSNDCISVLAFHWSSTFGRTGVFELPAELPKSLPLDKLESNPELLKAGTFGSDRDVWFLERLSRNRQVSKFDEWCARLGLPSGRGYRAGTGMDATDLVGMPRATAGDLRRGRMADTLGRLEETELDRTRDNAIFRGPLVLLPEGSLGTAPIAGRYTAAYDERDVVYNASFFGISFAGRDPQLARALAAVMHSRLVAYQLAFIGGTVGVKQTKIEVVDLDNVRLPPVDEFEPSTIRYLSDAYQELTATSHAGTAIEIGGVIDDIVETASGLSDLDRKLLIDVERRARAIFSESKSARASMSALPTDAEIERYSLNVCATFNATATADGDQILEPGAYTTLANDLIIVKLALTTGDAKRSNVVLNRAPILGSDSDLVQLLGGSEMPYLQSGKSLRIYMDQCVYLLKPAQYRYFSPSAGQSDSDRIVADLMEAIPPGGGIGQS